MKNCLFTSEVVRLRKMQTTPERHYTALTINVAGIITAHDMCDITKRILS